MENIQEELCQHMGYVYQQIYCLTYVDPNYPCDCGCHKGENILHIEPCCHDRSEPPTLARLEGVFRDNDGRVYMLFIGDKKFRVPIKDRPGWIIS